MTPQPHATDSARGLVVHPGDHDPTCEMSRVVRAAATDVEFVSTDDSLAPVSEEEFDFAVLGIDGVSPSRRRELLDRLESHLRDHRLLVHGRRVDDEEFGRLFGELRIGNLLLYDEQFPRNDVYTTLQKMLRPGDIFGLEKYFGWGARRRSFEIRSSSSIRELVDEAERFAGALELPRRLRANYTLVVEELLRNAIYSAPRGPDGDPRFDDVSRTADIELGDDEAVELRLIRDGARVGISVRDPFGSLEIGELLSYIGHCYRQNRDQISWSTPGAGLGLYQCFQSVSHLVVNIAAGERTEFIGLFTAWRRYADFASERPAFNAFVTEGPE